EEVKDEGEKVTEEVVPLKERGLKKYKDKSVEELEIRQGEIEDSKNEIERDEFNEIDAVLEQREWDSVVNTSLDNAIENLEKLKEKERTMPNGFGAYAELSELSAAQSVAEKYKNENVSRDEALADFKESFISGDPA
ncbi:MAG TPA: hypothetical protein DF712_14990, partial [Balneola sp.]|nr:hypothetical protein [Balneola sp.]